MVECWDDRIIQVVPNTGRALAGIIGDDIGILDLHKTNATIQTFRPTGKWYASARGTVPEEVFEVFEQVTRRKLILQANGGRCPGLSSAGEEFNWVVTLDGDVNFGWPLMMITDVKWR